MRILWIDDIQMIFGVETLFLDEDGIKAEGVAVASLDQNDWPIQLWLIEASHILFLFCAQEVVQLEFRTIDVAGIDEQRSCGAQLLLDLVPDHITGFHTESQLSKSATARRQCCELLIEGGDVDCASLGMKM